MGIKDMLRNVMNRSPTDTAARQSETKTIQQLVIDMGSGFYSWGGDLYKSDIIRSCVRPYVREVGMLGGKHYTGKEEVEAGRINSLLAFPNPYMSGQLMQEKIINRLMLNRNAFAYVQRDGAGKPIALYPINTGSVQALYSDTGELFLKMSIVNTGRMVTYPYKDLIHLRLDYMDDDVFGETARDTLAPLMELVDASDRSLKQAIKNGSVVRWLLTFNQSIRPEDIKKGVTDFVNSYFSESEGLGAIGTDAKASITAIEPKDYVPNYMQNNNLAARIYKFFGVSEAIINNSYTEDSWSAFYQAGITPIIKQMSDEYTRKLFDWNEIQHGQRIVFANTGLQYLSTKAKLELVSLVDRGAMVPNEWRATLGLGPIEGGDKPIRRLDTQVIDENAGKGAKE